MAALCLKDLEGKREKLQRDRTLFVPITHRITEIG